MSERTIPALSGSDISDDLEIDINMSGIVIHLLSLRDILGKSPLLSVFKSISFNVFNKIRRWAIIPRNNASMKSENESEKGKEDENDKSNATIDSTTGAPKIREGFIKMYEPLFILSPMGAGRDDAGGNSTGQNKSPANASTENTDGVSSSAIVSGTRLPVTLHGCYEIVGTWVLSCWTDSKGEILNLFTTKIADIRSASCTSVGLDWPSVLDWVLQKGIMLKLLLNLSVETIVVAKVGELMQKHELTTWKQLCENQCSKAVDEASPLSIVVLEFMRNQSFQTMANPVPRITVGDSRCPDFSCIVIPENPGSWFKFLDNEQYQNTIGDIGASGLLISATETKRNHGLYRRRLNSCFRELPPANDFSALEISVVCVVGGKKGGSGDVQLVRSLLRQYFDLSWLTVDPVSCKRDSALPIHVASLSKLGSQLV
jgi:hypothetical protein